MAGLGAARCLEETCIRPRPDFRRLEAVLRRTRPDEVPFYELFVNTPVMERILGKKVPDRAATVEFYYRLGRKRCPDRILRQELRVHDPALARRLRTEPTGFAAQVWTGKRRASPGGILPSCAGQPPWPEDRGGTAWHSPPGYAGHRQQSGRSWFVLHKFLGGADDGTGVAGLLHQSLDPAAKGGVGQVSAVPGENILNAVDGRDRDMEGVRR